MNKYKYLKKIIEMYEITDHSTGGIFSVIVTQNNDKISFSLDTSGAILSDSVSKCVELLKELVVVDCYNSVVREDEKPGKVIVAKQIEAKFTQRKAKKNSVTPRDKGETV